VTLNFKVATQMMHTTHRLNMVIISMKYFKNPTSKTKLWAGHNFAARSCCDLDPQGSNPNVVRDTSSQYVDHFCEIDFKSDFKKRSCGPDTIFLQGHAVTLTFKVATQVLCATHRLNMVMNSVK